MPFVSVPEAIEEIRAGRILVVVDDEDRENEGDLIVPAQFDLSMALGVAGRFDAPEYLAAVARVEGAALSQGIPLGAIAFTEGQTQALAARGYRLFLHGFDVLMLKDQVSAFRAWGG